MYNKYCTTDGCYYMMMIMNKYDIIRKINKTFTVNTCPYLCTFKIEIHAIYRISQTHLQHSTKYL